MPRGKRTEVRSDHSVPLVPAGTRLRYDYENASRWTDDELKLACNTLTNEGFEFEAVDQKVPVQLSEAVVRVGSEMKKRSIAFSPQ